MGLQALSVVLWAAGGVGYRPNLWKSTDGLHWTASPTPTTLPNRYQVELGQVAIVAGKPVVLADDAGAITFDGTKWSEVSGLNATVKQGRRDTIQSVAAHGRRLVAVGTAGPIGSGPDDAGIVSTSSDGTHWKRDTSAFANGLPVGVTATAGGFVAVGAEPETVANRRATDTDTHALAWESTDGVRWTRLDVHGSPQSGTDPIAPGEATTDLGVVTRWGRGFAAFGTSYDGDTVKPLLWLVPAPGHGAITEPNLGASVSASHDRAVVGLCGNGRHLVATGYYRTSAGVQPFISSTDDGVHWNTESTQLGASGEGLVWSCAKGPDGWVAVGWSGDADVPDATAWTSTDGVHWKRAAAPAGSPGSPAGTGVQRSSAVAWVGGRWGILGQDERVGDGSDGVLWALTSNGRWSTLNGAAVGGPGEQVFNAAIPYGKRLVAVGATLGRSGIWNIVPHS